MKKIDKILLGFIYSTVIALAIIGCNQPAEKSQPMSFAKTMESTAKPVRDTIKTSSGEIATVFDTYHKSVTVSYDSVVYVTSFLVSKPPVDTIVTPPVDPGNYGTLVYSTGYDKLSDIINNSNQQGNGGLSTTIYKTGPGSFKSVPANVSAGIRSEVQYSSSMTPNEGTIEWDAYYETIFRNSGHSLQFHPNTSGGSASPGLWHENGKFVWVNWSGGTNTKYATGYTIPQGQWIHCAFSYKKGSKDGYMKFVVDGKTLLDVKGIEVNDGSGFYLKVGVNMWANQSSVVYYDNLKIWKR